MSNSILYAKPGDFVFSDSGRPAGVHEVYSDGLTLEVEYEQDGRWSVGYFHLGWKYLKQVWNLAGHTADIEAPSVLPEVELPHT